MSSPCELLREDPDLGEHLRPDRLPAAERASAARTIKLPTGRWTSEFDLTTERYGIGLLILDGLLLRRVGVAGRVGAELLGPGDLVRPWQREDFGTTLPRAGVWRVLNPTRLAVLDADFAVRIAPFPEITSALFARAVRRSRHLAVSMAIVHHPRVWVRLHMLFWELADRWGKVRSDGIHVPLRLTHATLADLVAVRRPSVTKALGQLAERDLVHWTGTDWLLVGEPPAELDPDTAEPFEEGEDNGDEALARATVEQRGGTPM